MANTNPRAPHNKSREISKKGMGIHHDYFDDDEARDNRSKMATLDSIVNICSQPPQMKDMQDMQNRTCIFMITPFKYDESRPDRMPKPSNDGSGYNDIWDANHVRMPCSQKYVNKNKQLMWPYICQQLEQLNQKCHQNAATFKDLKITIENCALRHYNMECLEVLIEKILSDDEYSRFMSVVLPHVCTLALNVDKIFTQTPPLLRSGSECSLTMSQAQAASLLACAFFCLFPFRSGDEHPEYRDFQEPNFNRLYQKGPPQKIEKLKCILHYFRRITKKMPTGVISLRRNVLTTNLYPNWSNSKAKLSEMHLTMDTKIEDINCVLQVDFANEYIGGGVLGSGCVQEEIRFSICPEMLVSLLVCEKMEKNECIFLIGCERYSTYRSYAEQFQFDGNYDDDLPKDSWGRKWCHLVAMDAIFYREPATQYDMTHVNRELIKVYTSFRPRKTTKGPETQFGIATGNWGCGVFNGDRQLKGIIQLMVASEVERPLIYAAFGDKRLSQLFPQVYEYLLNQQATAADLYQYLERYSTRYHRETLFDYILRTPVSSF